MRSEAWSHHPPSVKFLPATPLTLAGPAFHTNLSTPCSAPPACDTAVPARGQRGPLHPPRPAARLETGELRPVAGHFLSRIRARSCPRAPVLSATPGPTPPRLSLPRRIRGSSYPAFRKHATVIP